MANQTFQFKKFEKIGDNITGTFQGFYEGEYGLNMLLKNAQGNFYVDLSKAQIRTLVRKNIAKFITGAKISVKFTEERKSKLNKKQSYKVFELKINDELIASALKPVNDNERIDLLLQDEDEE